MQTCTCEVRIGGSLNQSVFCYGVTPAEVQLLQAIHGGVDSVRQIAINGSEGDENRSAVEERNRLKAKYGAKDEQGRSYVDVLFPGIGGFGIPEKFSDIDLHPSLVVNRPASTSKKKKGDLSPQPVLRNPLPEAKAPVDSNDPEDLEADDMDFEDDEFIDANGNELNEGPDTDEGDLKDQAAFGVSTATDGSTDGEGAPSFLSDVTDADDGDKEGEKATTGQKKKPAAL